MHPGFGRYAGAIAAAGWETPADIDFSPPTRDELEAALFSAAAQPAIFSVADGDLESIRIF